MKRYRNRRDPTIINTGAGQWRGGERADLERLFEELGVWAPGMLTIAPDRTLTIYGNIVSAKAQLGDWVIHLTHLNLAVCSNAQFLDVWEPIGDTVQPAQSWWRRLCRSVSLRES